MKGHKNESPGSRILLTGGSGFLGRFIVNELLKDSSILPVSVLNILDVNPLEGISDERICFFQGDIRDSEQLEKACKGVDLLIHSAAIVDWGTKSREEVLSVNFHGTRKVVNAAREAGVKAFLYTSSLDVLVNGKPNIDVDEDTPYPSSHSTSYCESKYLAEKLVREADSGELSACVLRPSDIYGEGDPYHMGSLIAMAKKGFYVSIGRGKAKCQHVYAGNMAHAHVLAGAALLNGNEKIRGKAYFITDGPASNFFSFFNPLVAASGYRIRPKNFRLPCWLAYGLGAISEGFAFLWRPVRNYTPKMSRFAATYTCTSFTFNSDRAREDFGFTPVYSGKEAFERTTSYYRELKS